MGCVLSGRDSSLLTTEQRPAEHRWLFTTPPMSPFPLQPSRPTWTPTGLDPPPFSTHKSMPFERLHCFRYCWRPIPRSRKWLSRLVFSVARRKLNQANASIIPVLPTLHLSHRANARCILQDGASTQLLAFCREPPSASNAANECAWDDTLPRPGRRNQGG